MQNNLSDLNFFLKDGQNVEFACENTSCRYGDCEQLLDNYACHCNSVIK
jgi:hypothetical protein